MANEGERMKIDWKSFVKKYTVDKDKFPFGIRIYDGVQGSGKSLSMIYDMREIYNAFDDVTIITNIDLNLPEGVEYTYYESVQGLIDAITEVEVLKKRHVIVIIDEGLTYFAENGGIDPALMNKITQNRKNRRFIMISTQKFTRLNNRLRDFSLETVQCGHFANIQINKVRDDTKLHWDKEEMDFVGDKKFTYIFKRNNELFSLYDTNQIIKLDTKTKTSGLLGSKSPPVAVQVAR